MLGSQAALDFVALDATSLVVPTAVCAGHNLKICVPTRAGVLPKLFAQCTRMMLTIQNLGVCDCQGAGHWRLRRAVN
jgi:hypothetical protein